MKKTKKSSEKMLSISGELSTAEEKNMIIGMSSLDSLDGIETAKMDSVMEVDVMSLESVDSMKLTGGTGKLDPIRPANVLEAGLDELDSVQMMSDMEVMDELRPKAGKMRLSSFEAVELLDDEDKISVKGKKGKRRSSEKLESFSSVGHLGESFLSTTGQKPTFQFLSAQELIQNLPKVDEKGEPVIYNNLMILNLPDIEINEFCIKSKVNEHAKLVFTAFIDDREKEILKNVIVSTPIRVGYLSDKQKGIPFFSGVITNVKVYVEDGHQAVKVTAMSNTYSMDTYKNSASCQNTGTTYEALIKKVCNRTKASASYGIGGEAYNAALGAISVQYRETDWEYICRLASHKNQGLFVDMTKDTPVFSIGARGSERKDVTVITYEMAKDIRGFEIDHANYIENASDKDYVIYKAESYNILKIGDKISLDGKELYVREATYEMKNAIILGSYVLCPIRGLQQRKLMHTRIQGLSLNGKTTGVERDKVKVQLDIDSESNAEYLFPYSTMAASPDGSGWYCMPQEGDLVRVYFPDDNEANAFAISSVSSYTPDGSSGGNDMMSDPSVVYLRSPNNMVIRLAPDGITINANDGQGVIVMDTSGNVTIAAANSLSISATNDVNIIASNNMAIYAGESLKLSGQGAAIELDSSGNTRVTGQYVLEN